MQKGFFPRETITRQQVSYLQMGSMVLIIYSEDFLTTLEGRGKFETISSKTLNDAGNKIKVDK